MVRLSRMECAAARLAVAAALYDYVEERVPVRAQKVPHAGELDGIYRIFGKHSGLYLDGAPPAFDLHLGAASDSWTQDWIVRRAVADDTYTLQQLFSGRFLDSKVLGEDVVIGAENKNGQGSFLQHQDLHGRGWTTAGSSGSTTFALNGPHLESTQKWFLKLREVAEGEALSYELMQEGTNAHLREEDFLMAPATSPAEPGGSFSSSSSPRGSGPSLWVFEKVRDLPFLTGTYMLKQKNTDLALDSHDDGDDALTGTTSSGIMTAKMSGNGRKAKTSKTTTQLAMKALNMAADSQKWEFSLVQGSVYTIDQWSSGKYVDAVERQNSSYPYQFAGTLKLAEGDHSQLWYLQPLAVGSGNTAEWRIVQCSTGRVLDAFDVVPASSGPAAGSTAGPGSVTPASSTVVSAAATAPSAGSVAPLQALQTEAKFATTKKNVGSAGTASAASVVRYLHTVPASADKSGFTQKWVTLPMQKKPGFDGYYTLRHKSSGKVLSADAGSALGLALVGEGRAAAASIATPVLAGRDNVVVGSGLRAASGSVTSVGSLEVAGGSSRTSSSGGGEGAGGEGSTRATIRIIPPSPMSEEGGRRGSAASGGAALARGLAYTRPASESKRKNEGAASAAEEASASVNRIAQPVELVDFGTDDHDRGHRMSSPLVWQVKPIGHGALYSIIAAGPNLFLDSSVDVSPRPHATYVSEMKHRDRSQKWLVRPVKGNVVRIVKHQNSEALDVDTSTSYAGDLAEAGQGPQAHAVTKPLNVDSETQLWELVFVQSDCRSRVTSCAAFDCGFVDDGCGSFLFCGDHALLRQAARNQLAQGKAGKCAATGGGGGSVGALSASTSASSAPTGSAGAAAGAPLALLQHEQPAASGSGGETSGMAPGAPASSGSGSAAATAETGIAEAKPAPAPPGDVTFCLLEDADGSAPAGGRGTSATGNRSNIAVADFSSLSFVDQNSNAKKIEALTRTLEKYGPSPQCGLLKHRNAITKMPGMCFQNQCVCKPKLACEEGIECGFEPDGCGNQIACGARDLPQITSPAYVQTMRDFDLVTDPARTEAPVKSFCAERNSETNEPYKCDYYEQDYWKQKPPKREPALQVTAPVGSGSSFLGPRNGSGSYFFGASTTAAAAAESSRPFGAAAFFQRRLEAFQCRCTAKAQCDEGLTCGTQLDGCGATVACGTCKNASDKCVNNACVCQKKTKCESTCGEEDDGCGGKLSCGGGCKQKWQECKAVDAKLSATKKSCQCKQPPRTQCTPAECGKEVDNGCGGKLQCPTCPPKPKPVVVAPTTTPPPLIADPTLEDHAARAARQKVLELCHEYDRSVRPLALSQRQGQGPPDENELSAGTTPPAAADAAVDDKTAPEDPAADLLSQPPPGGGFSGSPPVFSAGSRSLPMKHPAGSRAPTRGSGLPVPACVISSPFGGTPKMVVAASAQAAMQVLEKTYASALAQAHEAIDRAPLAAVRGSREELLQLFSRAETDVRAIVRDAAARYRGVDNLGENAEKDADALVHFHFLQNYLVPLGLVDGNKFLAEGVPRAAGAYSGSWGGASGYSGQSGSAQAFSSGGESGFPGGFSYSFPEHDIHEAVGDEAWFKHLEKREANRQPHMFPGSFALLQQEPEERDPLSVDTIAEPLRGSPPAAPSAGTPAFGSSFSPGSFSGSFSGSGSSPFEYQPRESIRPFVARGTALSAAQIGARSRTLEARAARTATRTARKIVRDSFGAAADIPSSFSAGSSSRAGASVGSTGSTGSAGSKQSTAGSSALGSSGGHLSADKQDAAEKDSFALKALLAREIAAAAAHQAMGDVKRYGSKIRQTVTDHVDLEVADPVKEMLVENLEGEVERSAYRARTAKASLIGGAGRFWRHLGLQPVSVGAKMGEGGAGGNKDERFDGLGLAAWLRKNESRGVNFGE